MRSRGTARAHGAWIGAVLAVPLAAQADAGYQELIKLRGTRVITASRVSEPLQEAPATIRVIRREEIRARGYRSLLDLFRDLPGFKVERGVQEHFFNQLSVRGLPGPDKVLVLLDGHRITGPTNEPLPLLENTSLVLVQRVEVVYGPASALYGADAVAAVVNLITRGEEELREATLQGGDSDQRLAQLAWTGRLPGGSYRFGGQLFSDGQPDLSRAFPDYRAFQAQRTGLFPTAYLGTRTPATPWDPEPSHPLKTHSLQVGVDLGALALSYLRNGARFPSFLKNTPDNAIYNASAFIGHTLEVLGAQHAFPVGEVNLGARLSHARYEVDPGSNYRDLFGYFERAYKYARSSSLRLDVQADWEAGDWKTTLGFNHEALDALPWSADLAAPVDPSRDITGTLLGAPLPAAFYHLAYRNDGLFAQVQWRPARDWTATLGARGDRNSRYGDSFNPRLGLTWSPGPATTLKALYGSAFLAPSPYQAYLHYGAFEPAPGGGYQSAFWRLPNPDLHPQRIRTLEVSGQHLFEAGLELELSLFRIETRDLFDVVPDGTVTNHYQGHYLGWPVATILVMENQGEQVNEGGHLGLRHPWWGPGDLKGRLQATVSYVGGHVERPGSAAHTELGQVAPWIGQVGVELTWGPWSCAPRLLWVGTQRFSGVDPASGRRLRIPGYRVVDLVAERRIQSRAGAFALRLEVRNAFDARYRNLNEGAALGASPEFFGVPQDTRRVALGLRWSWTD